MSPADSPFASLPAPGPHPATAELRAYAAGTLAPADEHRIEAHSLDCERCADLITGFSMSDAATTDRAVAELRTRLQSMEEALAQLPPAQRRCLELFYLEKKSYREITTEIGLELNLVRSHLQNGKRMLRRQLEPPAPPAPPAAPTAARAPLPTADNNPLHVAR